MLTHPSVFIIEEFQARRWSPTRAAQYFKMTRQELSDILTKRVSLSKLQCKKIGEAFGTSWQVWFNLQKYYDDAKAKEG